MEDIELLKETKLASERLYDIVCDIKFKGLLTAGVLEAHLSSMNDYLDSLVAGGDRMISGLPTETIQRIYDRANEALEGDIEAAFVVYANALCDKRFRELTEEEKEQMQPVMNILDAINEYHILKQTLNSKSEFNGYEGK